MSRSLVLLAAAGALALAARPALAQPRQPIASPRDTARGTIGGAHLLVDYGRPSKRGRQIFPGLQKYGQVWRLGANEATGFVTDADVTIGGMRVPKGSYTLYAIPDTGRFTLVVNKQTGQWGTSYDQAQDLVRVPMSVKKLTVPIETLTVMLRPTTGRAGTFVMRWDDVEATVPVVATAGGPAAPAKPLKAPVSKDRP